MLKSFLPQLQLWTFRGRLLLFLLLFSGLLGALPVAAETRRVAVAPGMVASIDHDQDVFLEAIPLKGEGLYAFTRRLTGDTTASRLVSRINGRPRRLLVGVRYKVPYGILTQENKLRVMEALFPQDRAVAGGREHTVSGQPTVPSLWQVAEWFTGNGRSFAEIRSANRLTDDSLRPGQKLMIPNSLLLPPFRSSIPVVAALPSGDNRSQVLEFTSDEKGSYGVYRLRKGEALYSAVVARFTGGTFAEDVNRLAAELAVLNGIRDVTDIPVGQAIRIPFDLLLPEYLPTDDPRRQEYEKNRTESEKYSNTVQASRLEGITVILDAGHGGQDPGVTPSGVWESVYVYDIMLRVKKLLETTTAAKVVPTTRDGTDFRILDRDKLPNSRRHSVLTSPPYPIVDAKVGANLRWYLANSRHREATKKSGDDAKTLFLSIHADSLPPTHRGMMAYIPSASLTKGNYGKSGSVYTSRKEVRERPRVSYSWKERTRSEGLSRQLANNFLKSFQRHNLPIHKVKPIRDRIIRCRRCRPWVPAVVRYNAVPAKMLLEVCNLNNASDRKQLQTRAFRQKVAVAIVDGILDYYG